MNFEQSPLLGSEKEQPAKPPSGKAKRGLAILGMVGALSGALESNASADTDAPKDRQTEAQREMERLRSASDMHWKTQMEIQERAESIGPNGDVVLYYSGKRELDGTDAYYATKGYTILGEGDPAKVGDETWVDVKIEDLVGGDDIPTLLKHTSNVTLNGGYVTHDVNSKIAQNPYVQELYTLREKPPGFSSGDLLDKRAFLVSESYWEYYAKQSVETDARQRKANRAALLKAAEPFIAALHEEYRPHHEVRGDEFGVLEMEERWLAHLKKIDAFKPQPKKR